MCRAKPYPRCSGHARVRLQKAVESGDQEKIRNAKVDYYTSPVGIKELEDKGKTELAAKYSARRARLIEAGRQADIAKKVPVVLALDLDETSGDFVAGLRNYVAAKRGMTPEEAMQAFPEPTHYSFVDSGWFKDREEFMTEFGEAERAGIYKDMKPFKGVSKTLRALVENRDVEVHVVTARQQEWNADTRAWLRTHRFPYRSVTHTEEKQEVQGMDIFIDDSDKQITTLQAHGRQVIAFDNDTNDHVTANYRVKSWEEVPAVIKLVQKEKRQRLLSL